MTTHITTDELDAISKKWDWHTATSVDFACLIAEIRRLQAAAPAVGVDENELAHRMASASLAGGGHYSVLDMKNALRAIRPHLRPAQASVPAGEVVERIKAMQIAHAMSHEPFCDSNHWKDEVENEANAALAALCLPTTPNRQAECEALVEKVEGLITDSSVGNPIAQGRALAWNEGIRAARETIRQHFSDSGSKQQVEGSGGYEQERHQGGF